MITDERIGDFFKFLRGLMKSKIEECIVAKEPNEVIRLMKHDSQLQAVHNELLEIYYENMELNKKLRKSEWKSHQYKRAYNAKVVEYDEAINRIRELMK